MSPDLQQNPSNETMLVRTMDEHLSLKHGTGGVSVALAALFRDRYGDDCSVYVCNRAADVVLIILNQPTVIVPFCDKHARQMCEDYADLADHLPRLTPKTKALFPGSNDAASLSARLTPQHDESELRDDAEQEDDPRRADER